METKEQVRPPKFCFTTLPKRGCQPHKLQDTQRALKVLLPISKGSSEALAGHLRKILSDHIPFFHQKGQSPYP